MASSSSDDDDYVSTVGSGQTTTVRTVTTTTQITQHVVRRHGESTTVSSTNVSETTQATQAPAGASAAAGSPPTTGGSTAAAAAAASSAAAGGGEATAAPPPPGDGAGGGGGAAVTTTAASALVLTAAPFASKYSLGQQLGRGSFGKVYQATNSEGKGFAVKEVPPAGALTAATEIRAMQMLNPPGSTSHGTPVTMPCVEAFRRMLVTSGGGSGPLFHIVMPLCRGDLFGIAVRHHPTSGYTEETVRRIFTRVVLAVARMHALGMVHRDLKPENIMVQGSDITNVILGDFGMTLIPGRADPTASIAVEQLAPDFLAPEVLARPGPPAYSSASDVWALGGVLYQLLCGVRPFNDGSAKRRPSRRRIVHNIRTGNLTFNPKQGWEQLPQRRGCAADLIRLCTELEPEDRPDCAEILRHPWMTTVKLKAPHLQHAIDSMIESGQHPSARRRLRALVTATRLTSRLLQKHGGSSRQRAGGPRAAARAESPQATHCDVGGHIAATASATTTMVATGGGGGDGQRTEGTSTALVVNALGSVVPRQPGSKPSVYRRYVWTTLVVAGVATVTAIVARDSMSRLFRSPKQ